MTDERVDELLKDLDEALSVQPSPAVAARVRTRIAAQDGRRSGALVRLTAAMALVAVAAIGAAVWWQAEPAPGTARQKARTPPVSAAPGTAAGPSVRDHGETASRAARSRSSVASSRRVTRPAEPVRASTPREPEVIVSPAMRLAFEQLQRAVGSGRVTTESLLAAESDPQPAVVALETIQIFAIEIPTAAEHAAEVLLKGNGPRDLDGSRVPNPAKTAPLRRTS